MRKNSKTRSAKNIQEHYDLSNDFFKLFLDDTMMYSSAVFEKADEPLFDAQKRKIDLLAKKLNLKKGSKVLRNWLRLGSYGYALSKRIWM